MTSQSEVLSKWTTAINHTYRQVKESGEVVGFGITMPSSFDYVHNNGSDDIPMYKG